MDSAILWTTYNFDLVQWDDDPAPLRLGNKQQYRRSLATKRLARDRSLAIGSRDMRTSGSDSVSSGGTQSGFGSL